jgi:hypothetical protein
MAEARERAVSLDVHKHYVMVGAVNREQAVVLSPRRVPLEELGDWAAAHLNPTDVVALESTTNAGWVHDLLKPLVADIVVANPHHVKLIANSSVTLDRRDALVLAKMLAANWLPTIWLPPKHVRELRTLTRHRRRPDHHAAPGRGGARPGAAGRSGRDDGRRVGPVADRAAGGAAAGSGALSGTGAASGRVAAHARTGRRGSQPTTDARRHA